jgi:ADP-heptose:LPS heptosyltransferase
MEIVLLRLDRIGDFVLGIPAYRALRQAYAKDRISVVVSSEVAVLAKACPYFDEVYIFDALWLKPGALAKPRWKSALKLIKFLRSLPIDLVIDFRYQSRLDALVTGLSGAKRRVGFQLGWPSWFLTDRVPQPAPDTHQVDRNLLVLQNMGIPLQERRLEMWVDERDKKTAQDHLPSQELLPGIARIAIHLGAAMPSKRWPDESFSALIHELHFATQADILILGGEQDLPFAHEVVDGLECPVVNLVGKLDLKQMAALVQHCNVFVGCDSGATHVAAAMGIPVLCVFSAANESAVWRPWGTKVKVLTRHPDCSPCKAYECKRTDGYFCMADIKVDEVVEEVKRLMEEAH